MPCYQPSSLPSGVTTTGRTGYATEAECLAACKEGACCEGTSCSVKPQCQCQGTGKVFKGVGTVCTPNPCLPCPCPANSQPAFPVSMTFSYVVESAVPSTTGWENTFPACTASNASTYISLINALSFTAPVVYPSLSASAGSSTSGQVGGTLFDRNDCAKYQIYGDNTTNTEYLFSGSLSCGGSLSVGFKQLIRFATAEEYATLCQSYGERGFYFYSLEIPQNGRVIQAVPPCQGQTSVLQSNVVLGAGFLGPMYMPDCPVTVEDGFTRGFVARYDVAVRFQCRLNYANPLP